MIKIPVKTAGRIVGHSSFAGSIAAADRKNKMLRVDELDEKFRGRTFSGAWCDEREWVLEFSGPLFLRMFVTELNRNETDDDCDLIDWQVESTHTRAITSDWPAAKSLVWREDLIEAMDPAALVKCRIGAEFWRFWVVEFGLLVYLHKNPILCFSAIRRCDNGDLLIHVSDFE